MAACAGSITPSAYPQPSFTADADTVAWYQLGDVADASSAGLKLTNNGGVTFTQDNLDWSLNAKNSVAHFDGSAQSLTRAGLTVTSDFTLDAHVFWRGFRDRACGTTAQIVTLAAGTSGVSFEQACGVANGPRVRINGQTDLVAAPAFEDIADNAWHWLRFAISGGKVSVLLDGTALGSSGTLTGLGSANWTLTLGNQFYGEIDEVRLVKKALPAPPVAPSVAARPTYQELTGASPHFALDAQVTGANAKVVWAVVSGPGNVLFSAPTAATTDATFCAPGKYVLQAVAYNGELTASDEVVVRVWPAAGRAAPYKVLFLGNSFSFYNGTVGYRLWEYAKLSGEAVGEQYTSNPFIKMITSPGQNFQYHWYELNANGECTTCTDHVLPAPPTVNLTDFPGKNAQDVIANGGFDVVVMQSYSTSASRDVTNFFRYGKKLDRLVKRTGARTVFYQTWAYPGVDNTIAEEATLLSNYEALAQQTGAAISKVGHAFKDARDTLDGYAAFPKGILFSDKKHPDSFGTYLIAAVHFGVIYGKSPTALALYPGTGDIPTPVISGDMTKADKLRAIATAYAAQKPLQNGD